MILMFGSLLKRSIASLRCSRDIEPSILTHSIPRAERAGWRIAKVVVHDEKTRLHACLAVKLIRQNLIDLLTFSLRDQGDLTQFLRDESSLR